MSMPRSLRWSIASGPVLWRSSPIRFMRCSPWWRSRLRLSIIWKNLRRTTTATSFWNACRRSWPNYWNASASNTATAKTEGGEVMKQEDIDAIAQDIVDSIEGKSYPAEYCEQLMREECLTILDAIKAKVLKLCDRIEYNT